jgi:hypothetical protein
MGLGGILQRLKTEGVLSVYHDYRSGTLQDWSGNGHNGVGSSIAFIKNGAMALTSSGGVTVTSSALLEGTTGCLIVRFKKASLNNWLATKKSGANYQFDLYVDSTQIMFRDSGAPAYADITIPTYGEMTVAVNFIDGGAPAGYVNGIFKGNFDKVVSITPNNGSLGVGNNGIGSTVIGTIFYYFVWVTRQLSATEHAELYQELQVLA